MRSDSLTCEVRIIGDLAFCSVSYLEWLVGQVFERFGEIFYHPPNKYFCCLLFCHSCFFLDLSVTTKCVPAVFGTWWVSFLKVDPWLSYLKTHTRCFEKAINELKHSRISTPGKTSKNWISKEQTEKSTIHVLWFGQHSVVSYRIFSLGEKTWLTNKESWN